MEMVPFLGPTGLHADHAVDGILLPDTGHFRIFERIGKILDGLVNSAAK
jgi:hypothetical protein